MVAPAVTATATGTNDNEVNAHESNANTNCTEGKDQMSKTTENLQAGHHETPIGIEVNPTREPEKYQQVFGEAKSMPTAEIGEHSMTLDSNKNNTSAKDEKIVAAVSIPMSYADVTAGSSASGSSIKNKDGNGHVSAGMQTRSWSQSVNEEVIICFYAVLSDKFKFKEYSEEIGMVFEHGSLGGFSATPARFKPDGTEFRSDGTIKVDFRIKMRKSVFDRELRYKYVIDSLKPKGKRKWEMVYGKDSYSNGKDHLRNRSLKLNANHLKDGVFHQYDGFIHANPEGSKNMVTRFVNYFFSDREAHDELVRNSISGALAMLPHWEDFCSGSNAVDAIMSQINHIRNCLRPYFYKQSLDGGDSSQWDKVLRLYLQPVIEKLEGYLANPEEELKRVTIALAIIKLFSVSNFDVGKELIKTLCHSLAITADFDNRKCHTLDAIYQVFPNYKELFCPSLKDFLSYCMKNNMSQWPTVLPLYHFLSGECEPFTIPVDIPQHTDPSTKWWGTGSFKTEFATFKNKYDHKLLDDYVIQLGSMFAVDCLLPRAIAALVNIHQLEWLMDQVIIPVEIKFATLFYHIKAKGIYYKFVQKLMEKCFEREKGRVHESHCFRENGFYRLRLTLTNLQECYLLALEKRVESDYYGFVHAILNIFVDIIDKADRVSIESEAKKKLYEHLVHHFLNNLITAIGKWNFNVLPTYMALLGVDIFRDPNELHVWNAILSTSFAEVSRKNQFRDHFIRLLEKRISDMSHKQIIGLYCRTDFRNYCETLTEFFTKNALKAAESSILLMPDVEYYHGDGFDPWKVSDLLARAIEKNWPKTKQGSSCQDNELLHHIVSWSSFNISLRIFYYYLNKKFTLSNTYMTCMQEAILVLQTATDALVKSLFISDLELIARHTEQFVESVLFIDENKEWDSFFKHAPNKRLALMTILQVRFKELNTFTKELSLVREFVRHFAAINPDCVDDLKAKLAHVDNDGLMISEVCELGNPSDDFNVDLYQPKIIYFNLPTVANSVLQDFQRYEKSIIFGTVLSQKQNRLRSDWKVMNLESTIELLWMPVKKICDKLLHDVLTGDLESRDVGRYFGEFENHEEKLIKELNQLSDGAKAYVITERAKQIQLFSTASLSSCNCGYQQG